MIGIVREFQAFRSHRRLVRAFEQQRPYWKLAGLTEGETDQLFKNCIADIEGEVDRQRADREHSSR